MSELNQDINVKDTEGTVTLELDIFEQLDKSPKLKGKKIQYSTYIQSCKNILNGIERHDAPWGNSTKDVLEEWNASIKFLLNFYENNPFVRTWKYKTGVWTHSRYTLLSALHFRLHMALEIEKNPHYPQKKKTGSLENE
jgi:hypothetical protein